MPIPLDHVAFYTMDSVTGAVLNDEANYSDGTINGDVTQVDGAIRKALSFGGLDADYVDIGNLWDFITNTGIFHISFKLSLDAIPLPNNVVMANTPAASAEKGFMIAVNSGGDIRFDMDRGVGTSPIITTTTSGLGLILDIYYDIQISGDGVDLRIYLDGVLRHTASYAQAFSTGANTRSLHLGRANHTSLYHATACKIDQLRFFDRTLSVDEITSLLNETYYLPTDFIAHYTMDNIIGDQLKDESGSFDGTIVGALPVAGLIGNALNFNAVGEYATLGTSSDFDFSTASFSISLWLFQSTVQDAGIISKRIGGSSGWVLTTMATGAVCFRSAIGGAWVDTRMPTASGLLTPNTWHHLVLTRNGANWTIYVDSAIGSTLTIAGALSNVGTAIELARSDSVNELPYNGLLDQLRIYDRIVSQAEVDSLYTEGSLVNGLLSHYTMDNISGTTLFDETGNYDGTLVGTEATQVDGYLGKALSFGGAGSVTTTLLGLADMSLSFWLNVPTLGTLFLYSFGEEGYEVHINSAGSIRILNYNSTTLWDAPNATLTTGLYYHVVIIHTATPALFVNGAPVSLTISTLTTSPLTATLVLARRNGVTPFYLIADMDQFRVYNRPLAQVEIDALYYEEILTKILAGTITETLGVTNWHVRCYRIDNGILTGTIDTTNGTFSIDVGFANGVPHMITVVADQGTPWKQSMSVIINQLRYPTDPNSTPYYYKSTVGGTTGATEPAWVTTPGQTVVDGEVTWECVERMVQPITHSPLNPV